MGNVYVKHHEMLLALSIADKSRDLLMRKARELRDDHATLQRHLDTEESNHQTTRSELAHLTEAHSQLQHDLGEATSAVERLTRELSTSRSSITNLEKSLSEAKEAASLSAKKLQDQEAQQRQIQALTKERDEAKKLAEAMTVERDRAVTIKEETEALSARQYMTTVSLIRRSIPVIMTAIRQKYVAVVGPSPPFVRREFLSASFRAVNRLLNGVPDPNTDVDPEYINVMKEVQAADQEYIAAEKAKRARAKAEAAAKARADAGRGKRRPKRA